MRKYLVSLLVILLLGRLAISGQGYLEDSDEVDYYAAEDAFEALVQLDFVSFSQKIAITEGKPSETLVKTALVPLHRLWAWGLGVPRHSPKGLWILGAVNIVVSIGLLLVFYSLLLALNVRERNALLGMAMLGILINFNLYTRHLLGYDLGLLLQLLVLLWLVDKPHASRQTYLRLGGLSAIGFTVYHGYFMLVAFFGVLLVVNGGVPLAVRFKRGVWFGLSFMAVLLGYEVFFWLGGHSFFKESFIISSTISQGSFEEGFSFAWLYLQDVEGVYGLVLLVLFFVAVLLALFNKLATPIEQLVFGAFVLYLCFGFLVYFPKLFVFYGRIFHMYVPFIVLGVVYLLERFSTKHLKLTSLAIGVLLAVQYFVNIAALNSFTYPRFVLDKFGWMPPAASTSLHFCTELRFSEDYRHNWRFVQYAATPSKLPKGNYDVVNTCFFSHFPDWFMTSYLPYDKEQGEVVFSALHFMSFPAYTFEYCSTAGRAYYQEKRFMIQVVKQAE